MKLLEDTHRQSPGLHRLRPDDHFMILMETEETPMHIGAVLILETDEQRRTDFHRRLRTQFIERLAGTPLLVQLRSAPDGYDSDVWVDIVVDGLDERFVAVDAIDPGALLTFVAARSMERIDLTGPPFQVFTIADTGNGLAAVYLKMHHSVADGVGFQTLLGRLSDAVLPAHVRERGAVVPADAVWLAASAERFAAEAGDRAAHRARIEQAKAVLKGGTLAPRAQTPVLKLSGPTSSQRSYETLSVRLDRVKAVSVALQATINDIFLAIAGSALRRYLEQIDDLPETPIVVNSARSYRRAEHGDFGNRIVAMNPHLATDLTDPIDRLRAIQASMAAEWIRTPYEEAMLDAPETPFGARDRRAKFAGRVAGSAVLAGNVTLSNVPGPASIPSFGGHRLVANYPAPILGNGRFLNITSRRSGNSLDMGIMVDPTKIADIGALKRYVDEALTEYESLALN
jgi:diacylglycerol O-acyltransferase / wax synthase